MAAGDRRAQRDVLRETLQSLGNEGILETIEAVVVSGDLTNKGKSGGFDQFEEYLSLITPYVEPGRIVVVPGNHDVPKSHGPGDPERYRQFLRVTRDQDCVTPLLDAQDFSPDGTLNDAGRAHPHVVAGSGFEIVALNSSHFCWGDEPLPEDVFEALFTVPEEQLLEATQEIRKFDVPRISNAQMAAVTAYLRELYGGHLRPDGDDRVRIAVLHHQLLPVSHREEFKSFEALTNLGAVREFLVSLGIDVVLHGHKHEEALFWDYVADPQHLTVPPYRMLVAAAPGEFREGNPVARILEIGGRRKARDVAVIDVVSAARRGGEVRQHDVDLAQLWDRPVEVGSADSRSVRGETVSEVYARVQSLFDASHGEELRFLVCEIRNPRDAGQVPGDYPPPEGIADVERWMQDLVDWWQLPDPQLGQGAEFNHGNRIYRRWADQIQRAIDLFNRVKLADPYTTRAVMVLVDPQSETSAVDADFPSFVLVQFQLVQDAGGWRLDCSGYFRKQEMRYWWPINVGELAQVQSAVANNVRLNGTRARVGLLRTVTAFALVADRLPVVVAVPAIDRAVDQHPEALWKMAYGLVEPNRIEDKGEMRRTWATYLAELEPGTEDELPMSRRGLPAVVRCIDAIGGNPSPATDALRELTGFYALFKRPSDATEPRAHQEAKQKLDAFGNSLDDLFGPMGVQDHA